MSGSKLLFTCFFFFFLAYFVRPEETTRDKVLHYPSLKSPL